MFKRKDCLSKRRGREAERENILEIRQANDKEDEAKLSELYWLRLFCDIITVDKIVEVEKLT